MFKKLIVFVIVGILLISGVVLSFQTSSKELYTPQKISLKDLGIGSNASFVALDIYKDKMLIISSFPSRGIYVYNLTSKETMNLTTNTKGDMGGWGDIYEDIIVWSEKRNVERETNGSISVYGIYAYNLTSREEFPVCIDPTGSQRYPHIYEDIIVWVSYKFANEEGDAYLPPNIYGYNLTTKEKFLISTTPAEFPFFIYGDIVVWVDHRNKNRGIYGYNLTTKKEFPVCTRDGDLSLKGIWEDKILYMEQSSNTTYNIYYYNLTTKKENLIETVPIPFAASSIWENKMVWAEMEESPDKTVKTSMFLYNFTSNEKIKIYEKSEPKPEDFGDFSPILYFSIYDDTIAWIGCGVYSSRWGLWWSDIYYMKLDEG